MAATDARGVAAAAMNTTARKAASTSRVIADLVDELTICRGYYTTMVESLSGVLVDFRAGQFDNGALEKASKAGDQPMDCDKLLLQWNAHKNPFSKENGDNDKLARLAVAITSLLARKHIVQPYDYCVGVLSADPAAANATDARGVATAAVNITAHKAASTLQVITHLIDKLNTCHEIYGFMEEKLPGVRTDFGAG
ncbi:hypothetical protein PR202_gb09409 [Eleusine coracana subsp. coracana]|uniref:Pectinesterase inhibitor domain-containing protein n=1 Tax=Eleusine coracana subsp. coracana TaxID=191504 RepID=A0AAV5EGE8_ELECO|nr:hypothetical protein PR202_gb09409 [Eleusine coracana subsp. coracana]